MPDVEELEGVDFALVAYREDGEWYVEEIDEDHLHDLDSFVDEMQDCEGEEVTLGLASVDEDFFVIVRIDEEDDDIRVLLSDVTAATEWPIARSVIEALEIPMPEDDDEPAPAGDLTILADLGISAMELGAMLDDDDLYPEDVLGDIAQRLGFGALYDEVVGVPVP